MQERCTSVSALPVHFFHGSFNASVFDATEARGSGFLPRQCRLPLPASMCGALFRGLQASDAASVQIRGDHATVLLILLREQQRSEVLHPQLVECTLWKSFSRAFPLRQRYHFSNRRFAEPGNLAAGAGQFLWSRARCSLLCCTHVSMPDVAAHSGNVWYVHFLSVGLPGTRRFWRGRAIGCL